MSDPVYIDMATVARLLSTPSKTIDRRTAKRRLQKYGAAIKRFGEWVTTRELLLTVAPEAATRLTLERMELGELEGDLDDVLSLPKGAE